MLSCKGRTAGRQRQGTKLPYLCKTLFFIECFLYLIQTFAPRQGRATAATLLPTAAILPKA